MKYCLLGIILISFGDYSIRVKIHGCVNVKREYHGKVYLLKDNKIIDSVITYRYKSNALFTKWKKNYDFTFSSLGEGEYQIKYQNRFTVDSLINIELKGKKEEFVDICFDSIPAKFYTEATALDRLNEGDTLYINCYIAAGGEFGGYDEGLWITRRETKYIGSYHSLANTYELGRKNDRVLFYEKQKGKAKQIGVEKIFNDDQVKTIKRFLIQVKYYRTGQGYSNAPEFFSIYSKMDTIRKTKIEHEWSPYLELKREI